MSYPGAAAIFQSIERIAELKAGGDVLVVIACGIVAIALAWRTSDHLVETALTAVVTYGSFLLAESFHVSGVLATVAAGLLMGNLGVLVDDDEKRATISSPGREFVVAFWEFAAFIANSLVFLLIGVRGAGTAFAGAVWPVVLSRLCLWWRVER